MKAHVFIYFLYLMVYSLIGLVTLGLTDFPFFAISAKTFLSKIKITLRYICPTWSSFSLSESRQPEFHFALFQVESGEGWVGQMFCWSRQTHICAHHHQSVSALASIFFWSSKCCIATYFIYYLFYKFCFVWWYYVVFLSKFC